jgi:hypothetical protein
MFRYNITVTHRTTGAVNTFYRVPFFKALHVMSYLRSVHNVVSYEVSEANERSTAL